MKVLLLQSPVDPASAANVKNLPPLSLGIIVSYLRKNNINVKAYDLNENIYNNHHKTPKEEWLQLYNKDFLLNCLNDPDQIEKISDLYKYVLEGININEYDFVGISAGSCASFFEIHSSFLLGKLIQTKYNKPVVFGGVNVGIMFTNPLFDEVFQMVVKNFKYILIGPGEKSLVRLLQAYENGSIDEVYPTLNGSILFSRGYIFPNTVDNPTFTCPDFSDFNMDFYKTYLVENNEEKNIKQLYKLAFPFNVQLANFIKTNIPDLNHSANLIPYFFNYHCQYNCAFCPESSNAYKPITKDVKEIIDDISFLQNQYGSKYFQFLNNSFNLTPAFVRDFCTMLIDRGIKIYWSDCARVNGLTKELLELMYMAGCRKLIFGFETGSEKLLKYINKRLDTKKLSEVLQWCSELGIYGELEIIIGLPYEYDEDFDATYAFIEKNKKNINSIYPNRYYVIRHSLLGRYPEKYGIEIIQGETYESMLAQYKLLSINNFQVDQKDTGKTHFHVLKFNELNGRSFDIIEKETDIKFVKMTGLMLKLPGFEEMLQIENDIRRKVTG